MRNSILFSDEKRIKQVLLNLIGNALKFTFKGSIHITVRLVAGDFEKINHEKRDDENNTNRAKRIVRFDVQDTGIGIKKEDRQKLFKLFGKLESSSDINTNGNLPS